MGLLISRISAISLDHEQRRVVRRYAEDCKPRCREAGGDGALNRNGHADRFGIFFAIIFAVEIYIDRPAVKHCPCAAYSESWSPLVISYYAVFRLLFSPSVAERTCRSRSGGSDGALRTECLQKGDQVDLLGLRKSQRSQLTVQERIRCSAAIIIIDDLA